MTIIVSGTLHVDPADRETFLTARVPIMAHARAAPGCQDFSLTADRIDDGCVYVYERWDSHKELLDYRSSEGPELDDPTPVTAADVQLHHISSSEAP